MKWLRFAEAQYLLIYAGLVIVMMAFCPTGIVGLACGVKTPPPVSTPIATAC